MLTVLLLCNKLFDDRRLICDGGERESESESNGGLISLLLVKFSHTRIKSCLKSVNRVVNLIILISVVRNS